MAPVLEQGAVTRDIYLPAGVWYAEGDAERIYEGQQWLQDYPAPLDTLPYFVRASTQTDSAVASTGTTLLMFFVIIVNILRIY